jgi:hypothetical protein
VPDDLGLDEPDFVELEPGPMFVHLWVVAPGWVVALCVMLCVA